LRDAVAEVEVHDPGHPVVSLYLEAVDRAGKLAKVAADTSLAERMASISEQNIRVVSDAVRRGLDAVEMDGATRQRVFNAVARELRSVNAP
jgi:hypothetical protein